MKTYLLDTNIILRLLLKDVPSQYETAGQFIKKAKKKQIKLIIYPQAIFETVYILESHYHIPKYEIVSGIIPFISSTYVNIDNQLQLSKALFFYSHHNLSFVDIYFSVLCQTKGYNLLTFDKKLANFHKKNNS